MKANLYKKFREEILPKVQNELAVKNPEAVPKMEKIVLNMGLVDALKDQKLLEEAREQLTFIAGQKPVATRAKKAIAGFKLRKGDVIGLMVTLRGDRMYNFFEKLIHVVLPRVRDFHGVSQDSFDGHGNYSLGFAEISVFPEVETKVAGKQIGVEITIKTNAQTDERAKVLLTALGMPFRKGEGRREK